MLRPCLECGTPTSHGPRCPACAPPPRGHAHQQARRQTLSEETLCWLCGEPARPNDPLTADHIIARATAGPNAVLLDTRSNMRAAHLSCNSSRGMGGGRFTGGRDRVLPWGAVHGWT